MLKTLSMILIIGSLLFGAAASVARKVQGLFLALSFAALDVLAWLGLNFSPSLTLIFLEAGMICLSAGLIIFEEPDASSGVRSLGKVLEGAGFCLMIPAVYMYAFGEDHLNICIGAALVLGIGLTVLTARRGHFSASDAVLFGLSFCASLFTVFCGIFSTMLLFAGIGLLCLVPVKGRKDETFTGRGFVGWIGLLALALFSVLPAWL